MDTKRSNRFPDPRVKRYRVGGNSSFGGSVGESVKSGLTINLPYGGIAVTIPAGGGIIYPPGCTTITLPLFASTLALGGDGAIIGLTHRDGNISLPNGTHVLLNGGSMTSPPSQTINLPGGITSTGATINLSGGTILTVPSDYVFTKRTVALPVSEYLEREWSLPGDMILPQDATLTIPKNGNLVVGLGGITSSSDIILNGSTPFPREVTLGAALFFSFKISIPKGVRILAGTVVGPATDHLPAGTVIPGGNVFPSDTVVSAGIRLPTGTVLPGGTTVPRGTVLPAGIKLPRGATLPAGITLPGGTTLAKGN
ncbi:hypothetical protein QBC33DRAFT_599582 [Phialemonium atrogriseum]|uniref:Uncharacterized protein n=1 Tax=Phialemonium atrogriseum TaxID=1093897 RepID=A0AAJ0FH21_9PEZI|nr:uncharacterized protein QBC33DRAFT_599582 [Phialemonium atrogriseum]KAK1762943.1 hypothetical protein QBC33DRAFT_599582 [Phialemonium atrogriseum]